MAVVTTLAMALTVIVFLAAINLIVDEYGRGVMRTAVDEAARSGSLQGAAGGPVTACQTKADQVMHNLLAGPFGHHITVNCTVQGTQIVAVASGPLPGWLKVIPTDAVRVTGTAPLEQNPTPTS